jgi:hypothetical protein
MPREYFTRIGYGTGDNFEEAIVETGGIAIMDSFHTLKTLNNKIFKEVTP